MDFVIHRFALASPIRPSTPANNKSSVLLIDLCMQFLLIRRGSLLLGRCHEHAGGVLQQLYLPMRDLIRIDIKLLR